MQRKRARRSSGWKRKTEPVEPVLFFLSDDADDFSDIDLVRVVITVEAFPDVIHLRLVHRLSKDLAADQRILSFFVVYTVFCGNRGKSAGKVFIDITS